MKLYYSAAVAGVLALTACAPTNQSPTATAVDPFIGNRLVSENGTVFLFKADGTVGGTLRDQPIVGTYTADAREVCSTYTSPDFLAGQEFCSVVDFDGETVVFNRRDGSTSQAYTLEQ